MFASCNVNDDGTDKGDCIATIESTMVNRTVYIW